MTHYSNRRDSRPNLLAGLNFSLPRVKSASVKKVKGEVILTMRLRGKRRKNDRYALDLTGLFDKMNPDYTENGKGDWVPAVAAIGNDSAKRLFLILDHPKEIPESTEIAYGKKTHRVIVNSKAMVMKVLMVMQPEVQKPQIADSGLQIEFDVRMSNNDDRMWELIPKLQVQEFADEKIVPKVIPFRS